MNNAGILSAFKASSILVNLVVEERSRVSRVARVAFRLQLINKGKPCFLNSADTETRIIKGRILASLLKIKLKGTFDRKIRMAMKAAYKKNNGLYDMGVSIIASRKMAQQTTLTLASVLCMAVPRLA